MMTSRGKARLAFELVAAKTQRGSSTVIDRGPGRSTALAVFRLRAQQAAIRR